MAHCCGYIDLNKLTGIWHAPILSLMFEKGNNCSIYCRCSLYSVNIYNMVVLPRNGEQLYIVLLGGQGGLTSRAWSHCRSTRRAGECYARPVIVTT